MSRRNTFAKRSDGRDMHHWSAWIAEWAVYLSAAGHLSAGRVGELVSELLPDGWTTHTLRHRFASAAYRADRDIRAVQEPRRPSA